MNQTIPASKENSSALWTKYYILVMGISLFSSIAHQMLLATLPMYARYIGGDNSTAGLLTGIYSIVALLFRPVFGQMLDHRGRKVILLSGAILTIIITLSYHWAITVALLLVLRGVNGIAFSANTTALGTIASDIVPRSRLSEGIGYFGISMNIAMALGPALGLYLIGYSGYPLLFNGALALSLGSLVAVLFVNYEKREGGRTGNASQSQNVSGQFPENRKGVKIEALKDFLYEKTAVPLSGVMLLIAFSNGGIATFIPELAVSRGIANVSMFFMVYAGSMIWARFFSGKLADRIGVKRLLLPAMVLIFVSLLLMAIAQSLIVLLVAGGLYGMGYGVAQPLLNAEMIRVCPVHRRGAANGTFFSAMDIGIGVGAVMCGMLSQAFGFTVVYFVLAGFIVLSLLSYLHIESGSAEDIPDHA